jgi:hypothetical protein
VGLDVVLIFVVPIFVLIVAHFLFPLVDPPGAEGDRRELNWRVARADEAVAPREAAPLLRVNRSRAELAVGRRGAAALVQPADEIAFEDASPARREFNDRRSFAKRDQTFERPASEAGDRGGLIVSVYG